MSAQPRAQQQLMAVSIPISSLAPHDPIRRRFGLLHGISMVLMLGQIFAAASLVAAGPREDDEPPVLPNSTI